MSKKGKRGFFIIIGIIISVFLIWFLFKDINFAALVDTLKKANYYWLIPTIIVIILTMYMRAVRWHFMVLPIKKVKFSNLLAATCVGFMANNVLPLRLGEFVRAYSLSSQDKEITKSASLATIFVERIVFDLVALLSIFGITFWLSGSLQKQIDDQITVGVSIAVGIAIIGILVMLFLALHPEKVGNILTRYLFFLPDRFSDLIKSMILKFARGVEFMTNGKMVFWVGINTLIIWVLLGLSNLFVFAIFDFNIPAAAAFVLLVIVSISIMIPSSPGFIGVYHAGVAWSLKVYGIPKEEALSCALVLHACQYLTVTLMGFYFLKKEHLSLKQLEEEAVEEI